MSKKTFRDSTAHLDRFFSEPEKQPEPRSHDATYDMMDDATSDATENMTENSILNRVSRPVKRESGRTHTIYLSAPVGAALAKLAKKTKKSQSTLVDQILREVLIKEEK